MTTLDQNPSTSSDMGGPTWRGRPANRTVTLGVLVVFMAVGAFFVVTSYNRWAAVQPVSGGKTATGTVVSVVSGESCGRYGCSPNWTPTIRFETPDGASHTFAGPLYSSEIDTGQTVDVSYDPANPAAAHDVSASDTEGFVGIGFGVFALVFGLVSFLLGIGAIHRRTGLTSAREGSGWVGHRVIHSNVGVAAATALVLALAAVGLLVI